MEFDFNITKAKQTVILFIVSSSILIFLILFLDNKVINWFSEAIYLLLIILGIYILFVFVLLKRLFLLKTDKPKIVINENELIIPTYYFGLKYISLKSIHSIERVSLVKGEILIIGVKGGNGYFLDSYRFSCNEGFDEFVSILDGVVDENSNYKTREIIDYVSKTKAENIPLVTYCTIVICILIYLLGFVGGLENSYETYVFLGAGSKTVVSGQELYRIFSSSFIHANIFHLGVNILALSMLGEVLEKAVGSIRFLNILLVSVLIAFFSFIIFSNHYYGAGLSGGVFGIFGSYVAIRFRYEDYLPGSMSMMPLSRIIVVLVLELFFEFFFLENVDQYNHIGGFVAGFIYLYFAPLGAKLETIDQSLFLEKILFGLLVSSYTLGLIYFLMLYYGLILT